MCGYELYVITAAVPVEPRVLRLPEPEPEEGEAAADGAAPAVPLIDELVGEGCAALLM